MTRQIALAVLLLLTTTACGGPLGELFNTNSENTPEVKKRIVTLRVKEYWEKKSYYDGEVIEEYRSVDGTRLEGTYVLPIPRYQGLSEIVASRLEKDTSTRFTISVGLLNASGAFLAEPVVGKVASVDAQSDKRFTIDKGTGDGIKEGFLFTLRYKEDIPIEAEIMMYANGERPGGVSMIKALGKVISVTETTSVAETFGFREYLGVQTGNPVQFGFSDTPRYAVLKKLPLALTFIQTKYRVSPTVATQRLVNYFADTARRSAVPFLIEALGADEPIAREIAVKTLDRLAGNEEDYQPNDPNAVANWTKWWEAYEAHPNRLWPPTLEKETVTKRNGR